MKFQGFPYIIGWELTLNCNIKCIHCASTAGICRENELTLKESYAIVDQFPELFVKKVVFTGGEPLLNPNWFDLALYLKNLNINTGMVTNALLITKDTILKMKDCGMNEIGVSIDGPMVVHDLIRNRKGSFNKSISNIMNLVNNDIKVTVLTSVMGNNILLLQSLYKLIVSLDVSTWQIQPIFPTGRGRKNTFLHLSYDQFVDMGLFIKRLRPQALKKGLHIIPADSCGYFSSLDFPEFGWHGCTAGRFNLGIMSDGRIKGCLSWPDTFIEGDLRKNDLWSIWFRDGAFNNLRNIKNEDLKGTCKDCEVGVDCGGGCQAMSLSAVGDWHADPFCYRRLYKN
jgi:radical SAM protein with 4Fe4S-binding SPASM domain